MNMEIRDARKNLEDLLEGLSSSIGLPKVPTLDARDHCALLFDPGLIINLSADFSRGAFLLHGTLVRLKKGGPLMENLLQLSWRKVMDYWGCALALKEGEESPLLYRYVSLEGLSLEGFIEALRHFLGAMEAYQEAGQSMEPCEKNVRLSGSLKV